LKHIQIIIKIKVQREKMSEAPEYCAGASSNVGSTMSHQGFAVPGTDTAECVIFLFQDGNLNTPVKYAFATIGTILMAILTEYLFVVRREYIPRVESKYTRIFCEFSVYLLQTTMSFILMLIAMTYSVPLFLAVVFGLSVGHHFFNRGVEQSVTCGGARTLPSSDLIKESVDSGTSEKHGSAVEKVGETSTPEPAVV
jgi:hypothetical protein